MPSIEFHQIATEVVASSDRSIEIRSCPDQYMGPLSQILGKQSFPQRILATLRPNMPCVIMVLESPHIDEFIGNPGPAKGFTGEMIRMHLHMALPITNLHAYGLIVMNAIQYQCSLGVSTDLYRDKVFRATWNSGARESLGDRVKQLYRHGDIIMNCCTKGKDYQTETPLRLLVEKELRKILPGVRSVRRLHPSAWRKPLLIPTEWTAGALENRDTQHPQTLLSTLNSAYRKVSSDMHASSTSTRNFPVAKEELAAPGNNLVEVREDVVINGALCTVLVFSDGSSQHMKTETFDPQGLITAKAKRLLGMSVRTTCWNPRSAPGRWSSLGYFNDVFPA